MIDRADIDLIANNVPFTRLRNKRVLMTGGTGFVGRWMSIVPQGVNLTALSRAQYEAGEWRGRDWDYILHFAMCGPERVIECARRCNAQILFSSSGAVFDAEPGEYALEKMAAEKALLDSGLNVKIARMFAFAGAYLKNRYAITNMIHDGIDGPAIRIRSSRVNVTRSYLYAADMAVWLWRLLLDGQPGGIYEVGGSRAVTMMQLAREVQKNFIPPLQIYHEPMMTREPRAVYLPGKAIETQLELGVREYTTFEMAVKKTVQHFVEEARE